MPEAIIAIAAKPKRSEYPEFAIPEGLDLSGIKDGETKEILAVIKKKDDGKACLVSVDGVKLGEDDDIEEETDEQDDQSPPVPDQPFPQQGMERARSAGLM